MDSFGEPLVQEARGARHSRSAVEKTVVSVAGVGVVTVLQSRVNWIVTVAETVSK